MNDDQSRDDGLDDYDRTRASDMDCRPIYPNLYLEVYDVPDGDEEETKPVEVEV